MGFTDEQKSHIEEEIMKTVIAALKEGKVTEAELPQISDFVLEKIDTLQTQEDVIVFLAQLTGRWPIFSNLNTIEVGKVHELTEKEVTASVLSLARNGRIDEALHLAKTVTHS